MYLFHQRWRKTIPAAHQKAEAGAAGAGSKETIRFEDLEILRAAAPLIGLNQTEVSVIEVLAACARNSLNGLSARISDGWLASATGLEPEALSLSLGRLSVVKLVTLPQPCSLALRGRANRKTYDLSPLMQRLPELEWLIEAAERKRSEGALPDYTPDSFRDVLEDNDTPQYGDAKPAGQYGFLDSWPAALQQADADQNSTRSFPRKTATPRRGLMRQALTKRLAPRRMPRAQRRGRCPSPAASSPIFPKRQIKPAEMSHSLSERLLEGLQAWQKALGAAFGIRPVPAPVPVPAGAPVMPRAYPGLYNDAYWTQWNEEKSHTYS